MGFTLKGHRRVLGRAVEAGGRRGWCGSEGEVQVEGVLGAQRGRVVPLNAPCVNNLLPACRNCVRVGCVGLGAAAGVRRAGAVARAGWWCHGGAARGAEWLGLGVNLSLVPPRVLCKRGQVSRTAPWVVFSGIMMGFLFKGQGHFVHFCVYLAGGGGGRGS